MSLLLYPNVFSSGYVILETQCLMYKESNLFVYIFVVSCQFFQVIVKICPITLKIGMHVEFMQVLRWYFVTGMLVDLSVTSRLFLLQLCS